MSRRKKRRVTYVSPWTRATERFDWSVMRLRCLFGKHWVKFGTHPFCARCGKRVA